MKKWRGVLAWAEDWRQSKQREENRKEFLRDNYPPVERYIWHFWTADYFEIIEENHRESPPKIYEKPMANLNAVSIFAEGHVPQVTNMGRRIYRLDRIDQPVLFYDETNFVVEVQHHCFLVEKP